MNENPTRKELIDLRASGLTREQIAEKYVVSLSRVKRWIKDLKIKSPAAAKPKKEESSERRKALAIDETDGLTLIDQAKIILGIRMGIDWRGYLLDGRPISSTLLCKAAGLKVPEIY